MRCKSITLQNSRCKFRTRDNTEYCRLHRDNPRGYTRSIDRVKDLLRRADGLLAEFELSTKHVVRLLHSKIKILRREIEEVIAE